MLSSKFKVVRPQKRASSNARAIFTHPNGRHVLHGVVHGVRGLPYGVPHLIPHAPSHVRDLGRRRPDLDPAGLAAAAAALATAAAAATLGTAYHGTAVSGQQV